MHQDYFEGVLQLRSPKQDVLDFVRKAIEEDGEVKVAKERFHPDGIDLYLSDKKWIEHIGKRLAQRFEGILTVTSRLFSRDKSTSKEIHRVTVLFRQARFKRGDTIMVHGSPAVVLAIKDRVNLKDVRTGKRVVVDFEKVNRILSGQ